MYNDGRDIVIVAVSGGETRKTRLAIDDLVGSVGKCRNSVAIGVRDMNSWKAKVTASNVWEFSTKVAQIVVPSRGIDRWRIHELIDKASEVVAHKITPFADLEKVRRIIASQSEVVAVGGDGCLVVSTCGISSFDGVDGKEKHTSTGNRGNTGKRKA
jgi:hypothetical protein